LGKWSSGRKERGSRESAFLILGTQNIGEELKTIASKKNQPGIGVRRNQKSGKKRSEKRARMILQQKRWGFLLRGSGREKIYALK